MQPWTAVRSDGGEIAEAGTVLVEHATDAGGERRRGMGEFRPGGHGVQFIERTFEWEQADSISPSVGAQRRASGTAMVILATDRVRR